MAMAVRAASPPLDYPDSDLDDDHQDELVLSQILPEKTNCRKQWKKWK